MAAWRHFCKSAHFHLTFAHLIEAGLLVSLRHPIGPIAGGFSPLCRFAAFLSWGGG
jgi:hypothetical protein